jgi:hypothetical protein
VCLITAEENEVKICNTQTRAVRPIFKLILIEMSDASVQNNGVYLAKIFQLFGLAGGWGEGGRKYLFIEVLT